MELAALFPNDRVTIDKIDAVVIPELSHCVANVVSFNNKAACFAGVGVNLFEVVNGVGSHFFVSFIYRVYCPDIFGKVKQFRGENAERIWR